MAEDMEKLCCTCKYWEEFNNVCCNSNSENCADFIDPDSFCDEWEAKE